MRPDEIARWDERTIEDFILRYTEHPRLFGLFGFLLGLYFILPPWQLSAGEAILCFQAMVKDNRLSYPRGGASAIPRALCDAGRALRRRGAHARGGDGARAQPVDRSLAGDAQGRRRARRRRGGGHHGAARCGRAAGRCATFSERPCAARARAQEELRRGAGQDSAADATRAGRLHRRGLGARSQRRSVEPLAGALPAHLRGSRRRPGASGGAALLPHPHPLRSVAGAAGYAAFDGVRGGADHRRTAPARRRAGAPAASRSARRLRRPRLRRRAARRRARAGAGRARGGAVRRHHVDRRAGLVARKGRRPRVSTGQTPSQVGKNRPSVRTPLRGLYVCGAGGRGIGTELACQSALECVDALAADRVLRST